MKKLRVFQFYQFARAVKKNASDPEAWFGQGPQLLIQDLLTGDRKSEDLGGVRVYKFKMVHKLNPLA